MKAVDPATAGQRLARWETPLAREERGVRPSPPNWREPPPSVAVRFSTGAPAGTEVAMIGAVSRISLVVASFAGLTGAAAARDDGASEKPRQIRVLKSVKPSYQSTTNVAGPERPYTWPVSDRYRPVSHPYFGRAY